MKGASVAEACSLPEYISSCATTFIATPSLHFPRHLQGMTEEVPMTAEAA